VAVAVHVAVFVAVNVCVGVLEGVSVGVKLSARTVDCNTSWVIWFAWLVCSIPCAVAVLWATSVWRSASPVNTLAKDVSLSACSVSVPNPACRDAVTVMVAVDVGVYVHV